MSILPPPLDDSQDESPRTLSGSPTQAVVEELTTPTQEAIGNEDLIPSQLENERLERENERINQLTERFPEAEGTNDLALGMVNNQLVIKSEIGARSLKQYIKTYIFQAKKFFKDEEDLSDFTTLGSVGQIVMRAFKVDKETVAFQKNMVELCQAAVRAENNS